MRILQAANLMTLILVLVKELPQDMISGSTQFFVGITSASCRLLKWR